jgi:hypothetical protein
MRLICRVTWTTGWWRKPSPTLTPLFIETTGGWEEVSDTISPHTLRNFQGEIISSDKYTFVNLDEASSQDLESGLREFITDLTKRNAELEERRLALQDWQDSLAEQSKQMSERQLLISNFQEQFLPLNVDNKPPGIPNLSQIHPK